MLRMKRNCRIMALLVAGALTSGATGGFAQQATHSQKPGSNAVNPKMMLTATDLKGMRLVQQSPGFNVWMASADNAVVWRLVDIRWVLPTAAAAKSYLNSALQSQSERLRPVGEAPAIGSESHWFGGTTHNEFLELDMTQFIVLFRVNNVVTKLYIAQGPSLKGTMLGIPTVQAIAKRMVVHLTK